MAEPQSQETEEESMNKLTVTEEKIRVKVKTFPINSQNLKVKNYGEN